MKEAGRGGVVIKGFSGITAGAMQRGAACLG
jgi:hypothetical protein